MLTSHLNKLGSTLNQLKECGIKDRKCNPTQLPILRDIPKPTGLNEWNEKKNGRRSDPERHPLVALQPPIGRCGAGRKTKNHLEPEPLAVPLGTLLPLPSLGNPVPQPPPPSNRQSQLAGKQSPIQWKAKQTNH
ncbi:hypothetical protein CEXT_686461 [Caerostris extrusa]|uniref:Uncharacterized protein n=1 Tax=Caerostris extrusa TaxID=172846 RepID=A0AAV4RIW4_CAEEX|nr:hypothetical protein CEXT_686461 [Caerostris extrusa]